VKQKKKPKDNILWQEITDFFINQDILSMYYIEKVMMRK